MLELIERATGKAMLRAEVPAGPPEAAEEEEEEVSFFEQESQSPI